MPAHPYSPSPMDTQNVVLSPDLVALSERLAEKTHEIWAAERMAQGWSWGEARDEATKHHPCLILYAELAESEKVFDRETALGTLRAIVSFGYQIVSPS